MFRIVWRRDEVEALVRRDVAFRLRELARAAKARGDRALSRALYDVARELDP